MPLTISHEGQDRCCVASPARAVLHHPRVLATQHEDILRHVLANLFASVSHCCLETAWHLSRLRRIRVRCHTQSTVLLLRWCPVPGGAAVAIANLFSILIHPF